MHIVASTLVMHCYNAVHPGTTPPASSQHNYKNSSIDAANADACAVKAAGRTNLETGRDREQTQRHLHG